MGQTMRDTLFRLSSNQGSNLQHRIREMVISGILDGHIPPGSPLPSGRKLAQQLKVARNTVVLAYQQLVDEGYLESRERSGYYVRDDILSGRVQLRKTPPSCVTNETDWSTRIQHSVLSQRNISKPADWRNYPYPFIYGQFDPALFPIADWRDCSRNAVSVSAIYDWAGDRIDRDDPLLVEQIHTRLLPRRGVWASEEEILITLGAQHALYLISELLIGAQTRVGMEEPGYPDARNIFLSKTNLLHPIGVDSSGVTLTETLSNCDYIYVTPSHHFPTTITMSLERRETLLRHAVQSDLIVIEDDYENETNFVGDPTPALKSLDQHDRVIYIGSLSKTIAPGIRLGYLVAPPDIIHEARALRRLMLRHPPANNQHIVAQFIKRGHHDSLVRRLSHAYKERWQVMSRALSTHLPDAAQIPSFGGTSFWVEGPEKLNCRELQRLARDKGMLIEPGDMFFMQEPTPMNYFRLGFSSISADRIEPGVALLADIIHQIS